jgi:hypothetical protein
MAALTSIKTRVLFMPIQSRLHDRITVEVTHSHWVNALMADNRSPFEAFSPVGAIPTAANLTTHSGGEADFVATLLPALFGLIEAHRLEVPVGGAFRMNQVVETYAPMEENGGDGKIGVLP